MKRRTCLFGLMVLLAASLFVLPACDSGGGGGGAANTIVGSWTIVDSSYGFDVGWVVVYNADGTGSWNSVPLTYTYNTATGALTQSGGGPGGTMTVSWISSSKIQIVDPPSDYFVMVRN